MVNLDLDTYCENYLGQKSAIEERFMTKATIELAKKIVVNKNILNLGLGNGLTSHVLENIVKSQIVVEGSKKILDSFSFKSKKTIFIESYFEDFNYKNKFDVILANHVLEHVDNPIELMKEKFHKWLSDDGIAFITVPNAKSIHRLIGKQMQMINTEYDLNDSDIKAGHKRIYDIDLLKNHIQKANLKIIEMGGYNIKMVSLLQMQDWNQELLDAIFEVSKKIPPELCVNIWVTVKKSD